MRETRSRRRLARYGPLVALAGVLAFYFLPLADEGRTFVFRDLVVYTAPQDRVLREAILERHELPARNPYIYAGVEHAADPSCQVFYPPRVATALLFRVPRSITVYAVLHVALAATGAYLLGRALRASRPAACAGAAVYALSGPIVSLVENFPLLAGAAWLPFSLAFALRAARSSGRRRGRALVLSASAIALAALAGDFQAAVWAGLLSASVLAVSALGRRGAGETARGLGEAAVPSLLALGLAALLLLPARSLRESTDRATGLDERAAGAFSLAPERLLELAIPFPYGRSFPEGKTFVAAFEAPGSPVTEPWCETIHLGAFGLILGAFALVDPRTAARARPLAALLVLGLLLAMGPRLGILSPWRFLRAVVPFYDVFRYPEKHTILVSLAASGLAALGVDTLRDGQGWWRRRLVLLGTSVLCLVGVWVLSGSGGWLEGRLEAVVAAAHRPASAGAASVIMDEAQRSVARLFVEVFLASALLFDKKRTWLAIVPLLVALDVAVATGPRLFLGDARLYDEKPLGADLVRESGCRVLRWPRPAAEPIGRVFAESEMPERRQRERAVAARVRSWSGSVPASERVPAAHGFASFTPLRIERALDEGPFPDARQLDALAVRYLVLDENLAEREGIAVLASSSNGVGLCDRGPSVPRAPPPDFAGDVPGLFPGAIVSLAAAVLALACALLPGRRRSGA